MGLVTLRLPVVVSAAVYHQGNAATFKENYNAIFLKYDSGKHYLAVVNLNPISNDQSDLCTEKNDFLVMVFLEANYVRKLK